MQTLEMGRLSSMPNQKIKVEKSEKGFIVGKSQQQIEREEREQRIQERKANPKANPTNREIMEFLQDIVDRQSEILEKLNTP